jgi:hypothetical protein
MDEPFRQMMRRWAFPVLASAAVVAAAGCGAASSSPGGQVASIPTTAPTHSTATAPSKAGTGSSAAGGAISPVRRLDDTPQQINAILNAWNNCLVAHGATYGPVAGVAGSKNLANIPASAYAACKSKEPQLPPQEIPSQNPHYRADSIANVNCLRAHGVMVHLVADTSVFSNGLGWTFDGGSPLPANEGQIEQDCMLRAFGGKQ